MTVANLVNSVASNLTLKNEFRFGRQTVTLGANLTLTKLSPPLQFIDPAGARDLTLPAESVSEGLCFIIVNQANAAEDITVKDDSPATIGIIGQNEVGILVCDGTDWQSMITGTGAGLAAADITLADSGASYTAAEVEAAFTELAATTGAAIIGLADAGAFTAAVTVEAAIAEIYQHLLSVQSTHEIPLLAAMEKDGTALVAYADGANPQGGFAVGDSEIVGIRWNNHANPDEIGVSTLLPMDLDDSKNIVVHLLASKSGATIGDAVTFDVEAFFATVGALHDADADAGGTSDAMTGDATAKTLAELTVTISAADVPAVPCILTLMIQPTDGLLGTDDVILSGLWLEYSKKVLTS